MQIQIQIQIQIQMEPNAPKPHLVSAWFWLWVTPRGNSRRCKNFAGGALWWIFRHCAVSSVGVMNTHKILQYNSAVQFCSVILLNTRTILLYNYAVQYAIRFYIAMVWCIYNSALQETYNWPRFGALLHELQWIYSPLTCIVLWQKILTSYWTCKMT